jgi:hypothetical protein
VVLLLGFLSAHPPHPVQSIWFQIKPKSKTTDFRLLCCSLPSPMDVSHLQNGDKKTDFTGFIVMVLKQ